GDEPLGKTDARRGGDTLDRAEEIDERREIIRPHVQHRATAELVVELWVRMPRLGPVSGHEGGRGDGPANRAVVDELAARLDAAAEERIGRTAEADAFPVSRLDRPAGVIACNGER